MKKIEVVAAIIIYENEILCMQRGKSIHDYLSYKYEFPGGKIEPGETHVQALMRELKEEMELDLKIYEEDFFMTIDHLYPDFEIEMHSYICKVNNKKFERKEHNDHCWLKQEDLKSLDWAPADVPMVEKLANM